MREGYDIINQLGPANRFDRLAGEAHIAGAKYHDRKLVDLGTELAKLIKTIPYDSDKYYLIVAKAQEIEDQLKSISKNQDEVEDWFFSYEGYDFTFSHDKILGRYRITVGVERAKLYEMSDPIEKKIRPQILKWFESQGSIDKIKDGHDLPVPFEGSISVSADHDDGTILWKDQRGRVIFQWVGFTHGNGEESGEWETFFFYGPDGEKAARDFWNQIKTAR